MTTTSDPSAAAAAASTPEIVIIPAKPSPQQLAECLTQQPKFAEAVFDIYDHLQATATSLREHVSSAGVSHIMIENTMNRFDGEIRTNASNITLINAKVDALLAVNAQSAKLQALEAEIASLKANGIPQPPGLDLSLIHI